jgi:hypothetical protein
MSAAPSFPDQTDGLPPVPALSEALEAHLTGRLMPVYPADSARDRTGVTFRELPDSWRALPLPAPLLGEARLALAALAAHLSPAAGDNPRWLERRLCAFQAHFPPVPAHPGSARESLADWSAALAPQPRWAVEEVARRFRRNPDLLQAPSLAEFIRQVRDLTGPAQRRRDRLACLLEVPRGGKPRAPRPSASGPAVDLVRSLAATLRKVR